MDTLDRLSEKMSSLVVGLSAVLFVGGWRKI